jgi:hypothetical protein
MTMMTMTTMKTMTTMTTMMEMNPKGQVERVNLAHQREVQPTTRKKRRLGWFSCLPTRRISEDLFVCSNCKRSSSALPKIDEDNIVDNYDVRMTLRSLATKPKIKSFRSCRGCYRPSNYWYYAEAKPRSRSKHLTKRICRRNNKLRPAMVRYRSAPFKLPKPHRKAGQIWPLLPHGKTRKRDNQEEEAEQRVRKRRRISATSLTAPDWITSVNRKIRKRFSNPNSTKDWVAIVNDKHGMIPLQLPGDIEFFTSPPRQAFLKNLALLAATEGSRRSMLRSTRRQCAACAANIGVYQSFVRPILLTPAFSIGRLDLQAARSALRPIGELEEDDSGLEGGDIDFEDEDEDEMSPVVFKTVSFDLDNNLVHNIISLYEYSDEECDACFGTEEEKDKSQREREQVVARMNKSPSSAFRGTSRLYRGLETFHKKGEEETTARIIAHCDGVLDEDESQFKSGSMNEWKLRWVSEGLSERSIALAIDRANTDRAEAEKVYGEGRRKKPKRTFMRQGTRSSERLAARGLGSAFTLSGQRFSNRLANKLKLVL